MYVKTTLKKLVNRLGCDDPSAFVTYSALHDPSKPREHGSSHKMICTDGYSVKGNASMTCLNDSIWTSPKFSCVEGKNFCR